MKPLSDGDRSLRSAPKKGFILRSLLLLLGTYLGICAMLSFVQRKLIYVPRSTPVSIEETGFDPNRIVEVSLPVEQGIELQGWYCSASPHRQRSRRLVILFGGNAGNRLNRVRILDQFNQLGCDALIFDYRGYGGSGGQPTEQALASDSLKIWRYAVEELEFESHEILICGQSLGGGVSVRLAYELCEQQISPGGLILRATFTSLTDAAQHHYPWLPVKTLLVERYPSIDRIREITCPLLVMHGKQDTIAPYQLGRQLFNAAPEQSECGFAKRFVELPDAGHNDMMSVASDHIFDITQNFLNDLHVHAQRIR